MATSPTPSTIVLITGANQGIGFHTSRALALSPHNYHIIMTGRRKPALDAAVAALLAENDNNNNKQLSLEALELDVTSDASIAAAASYISSTHGHLDVLINNAGIREGYALKDRAMFQRVFDVNVFGAAMVTDYFLPLLEKSTQTKRIVFLSTAVASFANIDDVNYYARDRSQYRTYLASKAALNMVARQYALKYEKDPTWKVNLACPGYVKTNLVDFDEKALPVETGTENVVRLATSGPEGETATFTNRSGRVPW